MSILEKLCKFKKSESEEIKDSELYNLDSTICAFIIPKLKKFKEVTKSYPPQVGSFENWQDTIDKMIYWMEMYLDDDNRYNRTEEEKTKMEEGKKLFFDYFENLWW